MNTSNPTNKPTRHPHEAFAAARRLAVTAALAAMPCVAQAATVNYTDFETNSQGSAFTTGNVAGQGTPAWANFFWGFENTYGSANVVSGESYLTGNQALQVGGYGSGALTLTTPTTADWVEFAYKPNFTSGTPGYAHAITTDGANSGNQEIKLLFFWDGAAGTIVTDAGLRPPGNGTYTGTPIGSFTNSAWQTISISQDVVAGTYDVFLNGSPTAAGSGSWNAGVALDQMGTIAFSTTTVPWTQLGNWYVDGVNIADAPIYTVPEPSTYALLVLTGVGLAGHMVRRRRRA